MQKKSKKSNNIFLINTKKKLKKIINTLGPGFITGAADDDPSGIGTYSIAGAKYGLLLAWLIPFQLPLMFVIQEMSGRIGVVTGRGLAANMKKFFPRSILYAAIIILVFANIINIGADIAVMGSSLKLILGYNANFWSIVITIIIILMEVFVSYRNYSRILSFFAIFLFAYIFTALITATDWIEILKFTFTPHIQFNKNFLLVGTGFIGTTISPYLFFWQASQEVEEVREQKVKNRSVKYLRAAISRLRLDTFLGMVFSQIITFFIVVTTFSTLYKNGITEVNSAYDAAIALKPLAGEWAFLVFTLGIVGAGLLGVPVLAGSAAYALSEVFDKKEGLNYKYKDAKFFYRIISISTLVGLAINFIGISPMKALLYSAVINGIAAVPIIAFLIILANKDEVMGRYKNGLFSNVVAYITFAVIFLAGIILLI